MPSLPSCADFTGQSLTCLALQDGFAEVDEILENTRISTMTGELAPMKPVSV